MYQVDRRRRVAGHRGQWHGRMAFDVDRRREGRGNARGDLAGDRADLPFEVAHAGFARVLGDDAPQRALVHVHQLRRQAVFGELAGQQVAPRDVQLVFFAVARELDDLHAVEQRRVDGAQLVGRGDEKHLRQVDVDLEVVVAEGVVLRRVEHFEQRGARVARKASGRHLVDLIEHEDRVVRACLLERLHDAARNRADVGAAVAPDFGLVAHTAQRDAHEGAIHRAGDRLPERGLADAWRADEAEDRPLHVALQLPHGQVLDDALLDLVEIVVILVEHAARLARIEAVFGRDAPRDLEDPLDVRAQHLVLGRRLRHPLEALEFTRGRLPDGVGKLGLVDALAEVAGVGGVRLAEFVLDRLELLAQVVLPLRVAHLLLRLRLDLALELEQRDLALQRGRNRVELDHELVLLEQQLLVVGLEVEQAREDVGETQRVVDAEQQRPHIGRQAAGQRDGLVDLLAHAAHVGIDLDRLLGGVGVGGDDGAHEIAVARQ